MGSDIISVKHCVLGCAFMVLASAWVALLPQWVQKLFICQFVQHDSKCWHVSFSRRLQRLHSGGMSYIGHIHVLAISKF